MRNSTRLSTYNLKEFPSLSCSFQLKYHTLLAYTIHRRTLRSWTLVWKQAPESSLDPSNENGPISFTSSALPDLAYIRACMNLGPHRALETRNASLIAARIAKAPSPSRGRFLIPALIYSTHALSIPVRLGIDSVARSQAFFGVSAILSPVWNVQSS